MTTHIPSIAVGDISDTVDTEKKFALDFSGVTSGNTTTLALPSGSRTFTFPDANTTLVGLDLVQTLTNKTINASVNTLTNIDATNITAGTAAAANGGTGITSYAVGDILVATGVTTLSKLSDIAVGNALISGGVGVAPSYGKIGLTTHISGVLGVANGGTSFSAYAVGDILYASAVGVLSALADIATGNALITGGVGVAPSYGKIGLTTHVSGVLGVANGGTNSSTALNNNRIIGSSGGTIGEFGAMTNGQLLIGSTGAAPVVASLTAGSGITITPGAGSISIAATGGGGGGIYTFAISSLQISASSNGTYATIAHIPWQNTKFSTYTTRTIAFHLTFTDRNLDIQITDNTAATEYGSLLAVASSGIKTFTFTNPGADDFLLIRVRKTASGGTNPRLNGIVMELT